MKAAIYTQYGAPEVLQVVDIDKPQPKEKEILVKIHAATVTSGDVRLRASDFPPLFWLPARMMFGLFRPKKKILGHELSGVVEAVGEGVTKFQVGDEVFGTTTLLKTGSYAEYICLPEEWKQGVVGKKPANLSFQDAAALPIGGMTALYLWKKAHIQKGQKVLVYGASGSVGTYAVQLAVHFGAEVTGVCSTTNVEMVRSLGAERVVDYKKQDYASLSDKFDIVFDAVGKTSKARAQGVLAKSGAFVSITMLTQETTEDLLTLKELAEKGEIRPVMDKSYPLQEIVKAHQYVDTGRKKGNVVVEM